MLTPLALRVMSRILRLNRSRDFGAIVRLMSGSVVKLNPRNFRSCGRATARSEEHTSELQSQSNLVCRLLLEKKKKNQRHRFSILTHAITSRLPNDQQL